MTLEEIKNLLGHCRFEVLGLKANLYITQTGEDYLLQVGVEIPHIYTGKPELKKGEKHFMSNRAIPEEIVRKAMKACLDFTENEAREGFTFKGQTIYRRSYPLADLHAFCKAVGYAERVKAIKSFSLAENF